MSAKGTSSVNRYRPLGALIWVLFVLGAVLVWMHMDKIQLWNYSNGVGVIFRRADGDNNTSSTGFLGQFSSLNVPLTSGLEFPTTQLSQFVTSLGAGSVSISSIDEPSGSTAATSSDTEFTNNFPSSTLVTTSGSSSSLTQQTTTSSQAPTTQFTSTSSEPTSTSESSSSGSGSVFSSSSLLTITSSSSSSSTSSSSSSSIASSTSDSSSSSETAETDSSSSSTTPGISLSRSNTGSFTEAQVTTESDGRTTVATFTSYFPTATSSPQNKSSGGGLSETNKIVVGVVVGVGGAILIGILAFLYYMWRKRSSKNEYESGSWTFWRKNEKSAGKDFLDDELGVRDRNINQGSNF